MIHTIPITRLGQLLDSVVGYDHTYAPPDSPPPALFKHLPLNATVDTLPDSGIPKELGVSDLKAMVGRPEVAPKPGKTATGFLEIINEIHQLFRTTTGHIGALMTEAEDLDIEQSLQFTRVSDLRQAYEKSMKGLNALCIAKMFPGMGTQRAEMLNILKTNWSGLAEKLEPFAEYFQPSTSIPTIAKLAAYIEKTRTNLNEDAHPALVAMVTSFGQSDCPYIPIQIKRGEEIIKFSIPNGFVGNSERQDVPQQDVLDYATSGNAFAFFDLNSKGVLDWNRFPPIGRQFSKPAIGECVEIIHTIERTVPPIIDALVEKGIPAHEARQLVHLDVDKAPLAAVVAKNKDACETLVRALCQGIAQENLPTERYDAYARTLRFITDLHKEVGVELAPEISLKAQRALHTAVIGGDITPS